MKGGRRGQKKGWKGSDKSERKLDGVRASKAMVRQGWTGIAVRREARASYRVRRGSDRDREWSDEGQGRVRVPHRADGSRGVRPGRVGLLAV